jgi:hypothetical protein
VKKNDHDHGTPHSSPLQYIFSQTWSKPCIVHYTVVKNDQRELTPPRPYRYRA